VGADVGFICGFMWVLMLVLSVGLCGC